MTIQDTAICFCPHDASDHTILPEWADYLLAAGLRKRLVTKLPITGNGGFVHAFRVECYAEGWQAITGAGLQEGKIVF